MSEIKARLTIPIEWGEKTRCPICAARGMSVLRQANAPDQFQCRTCGLSFELEMGGNHIYVTCWPVSMADQVQAAGILWLTMDELKQFVDRAATIPVITASNSLPNQTQPASVPLKSENKADLPGGQEMQTYPSASVQQVSQLDLERSDLLIQIKNLRALGNPYKQIQTILTQKISDPAQLKVALEITGKMERQDQGRQQKKLLSSIFIAILFLFILIGAGFMIQRIFIKQPSSVSATQVGASVPPIQVNAGPTSPPNIVDMLKLATPVIHRYPTLPASDPKSMSECPRSTDAAAKLFGGQAENWKSMQGGWIMANPVKATTINVPNGMKAAYLLMRKTISLAEVQGPAKMENVYYVSVSCP